METFRAKVHIIGVNPYVLLPAAILRKIFSAAGKKKGPVPVKGTLDGHRYVQTLVRYSGKWRLYLNTPMRDAAGIGVGDAATFTIQFDPKPREVAMHPKLKTALNKNKKAREVFDKLPASRQKEIIKYISFLKSEESVARNVERAIRFLQKKERFIGRDEP